MKVLLLSPNFHPEKTGIGVSATECARFIASFDCEVQVVTCLPHYPEWEVHPEYRGRLLVEEQFEEGIGVTRAWLYVPRRLNTLGRLLHEFTFALSTSMVCLWKRSDLILSISPPLSASVMASLVAKLKRKPHWCYIQDIQPDAAIVLGMLKNPVMRFIARTLERLLYRSADKLLVLSEGMKENLLKKGVAEENITVLPLSVDVGALRERPSQESLFRTNYGLEEKFVVLFSGNIGVKHNPKVLVEVAEAMREREDIFFAVVGDGAEKGSIEEEILAKSLPNIRVYPLCERELLGDMLQSADVLLLTQRKEVLDIVVPSKLVAYLTSGRAVIASVHEDSEAAKLLSTYDAGIVVDAEDAEALRVAIESLSNDPQEAQRLGERGLDLVRKLYDFPVVRNENYGPLFGDSEQQGHESSEDITAREQQRDRGELQSPTESV